MANREELGIIRGARAGDAVCQLALGKLYLFGGASLPLSLPTALHWLNRAALQEQDQAWMLIGSHVPFEHAQHCLPAALAWYERAYDAGVQQAGVVLAQLLLQQPPCAAATPDAYPALRDKALRALDAAARSGSDEARWLLAQQPPAASAAASAGVSAAATKGDRAAPPPSWQRPPRLPKAARQPGPPQPMRSAPPAPPQPPSELQSESQSALQSRPQPRQQPAPQSIQQSPRQSQQAHQSHPAFSTQPSHPGDHGISAQQHAMLDVTWDNARGSYLERALPLLRQLLEGGPLDAEAARLADWSPGPRTLRLLARCATWHEVAPMHGELLRQCRELAAHGGDRGAQLALGLWFARMDHDGKRQAQGIAAVNFKRAIRWLTLAGEQGLAEAWFALSRIYLKPEFSQRCVAEAQRYLERAAEMGHCGAQLECGMYAWRNRRGDDHGDVRALYWLQKAVAQGCAEAAAALERIAPRPLQSGWADEIMAGATRDTLASQPLLAARLELARLFGLNRAEALLLDLNTADHGHCLVVDIRASYGRSKRRLISLGTSERQALDRIGRQFEAIDAGPDGVEGNYRQRLYRLKTWLPHAGGEQRLAA